MTAGVRTAWDDVIGQPRAVEQLTAAVARPVHSYLFVGPAGSGKRVAARVFAAALLCASGGDDDCDICRRVLNAVHPDVAFVERQGAAITVDEAREISRLASRSPVEGRRKVLVLTDFHLVEHAAPALLKTIEEPPETTVFVILADHVPPELVTIASRSCRIDFGPIPDSIVAATLEAEGTEPGRAAEIAAASRGNLDRARLLVGDTGFSDRLATWRAVPGRLDGTGAAAAAAAADIVAAIETVTAPIRARQEAELAAIAERQKLYGDAGPNRRDLDARHRREQRRVRNDELRSGLAILAAHYRDRLTTGSAEAAADVARVDAITQAAEAILRYPNELLLLQALLVRLSRAGA